MLNGLRLASLIEKAEITSVYGGISAGDTSDLFLIAGAATDIVVLGGECAFSTEIIQSREQISGAEGGLGVGGDGGQQGGLPQGQ